MTNAAELTAALFHVAMHLKATLRVNAITLTPTAIIMIHNDGNTQLWDVPPLQATIPDHIETLNVPSSPESNTLPASVPGSPDSFVLPMPEDDPAVDALFQLPEPRSPLPILDIKEEEDDQPQLVPSSPPATSTTSTSFLLDDDTSTVVTPQAILADLQNATAQDITLLLRLSPEPKEALSRLHHLYAIESQRLHKNTHHQLHLAHLIGKFFQTHPPEAQASVAGRFSSARIRRRFVQMVQRAHELTTHAGLPWIYGTTRLTTRVLTHMTNQQYDAVIRPNLQTLPLSTMLRQAEDPSRSEDLAFSDGGHV
jgi:hypothetical protein